MKCNQGKKLTDMEKACIVYGYVLAEEAKEQGLFKELTVEEVIQLFLDPAIK